MVIIKKECFGLHDYAREDCFDCSLRIDCMTKKFQDKEPDDTWGDSEKPDCYGSYKGRLDCGSCPYNNDCSDTSKDILRGKTQKIRYDGKYKTRGKEIKRDVF